MANHAVSLYRRSDEKGVIGYKVLNHRSSGVPLVLIHGMSSIGTLDWIDLAKAISASRPVLVFDNRGMGHSLVNTDENYSLEDLADDTIDIVKYLKWPVIDLLGFSMGGMIAQTIAVRDSLPFAIKHLILAATSAKPPKSELVAIVKARMKSEKSPDNSLEHRIAQSTPFILAGYDTLYVKDPKNKELLDSRIFQSATSFRPFANTIRQNRAIAKYDVRSKLSKLSPSNKTLRGVPPPKVLIIHGKLDKSVHYSEGEELKKLLPFAIEAKTPLQSQYGHMWYDYFGIEFWANLLSRFCDDTYTESDPVDSPVENQSRQKARL